MELNILSNAQVLTRGLELMGISFERQNRQHYFPKVRRFRMLFGSHPRVYAHLWVELQTTPCDEARISFNKDKDFDNFMICLYFLKRYPVEEDLASRFGVHEQTSRRWWNYYARKIAALKPLYIKWPDDWENLIFIISFDCVNFGINEPRHETLHKDKKMFDRKGGKAGWSYEIALHLWKSQIVWINGPFPPNDGGDTAIYKKEGGLMEKIPDGKKGIADKIYKGLPKVALHNSLDSEEVRIFKRRARSRQESINARFKSFHVLKQRFRHGKDNHSLCFDAVAVICAVQLEHGSPLWDV